MTPENASTPPLAPMWRRYLAGSFDFVWGFLLWFHLLRNGIHLKLGLEPTVELAFAGAMVFVVLLSPLVPMLTNQWTPGRWIFGLGFSGIRGQRVRLWQPMIRDFFHTAAWAIPPFMALHILTLIRKRSVVEIALGLVVVRRPRLPPRRPASTPAPLKTHAKLD